MLRFGRTRLNGVIPFQRHPVVGHRGGFARLFCPQLIEEAGSKFIAFQTNLSMNPAKHTLRGMHFQRPPHSEAKVVQVLSGAVFDVVVDMRPESSTYLSWQGFELSRENGRGVHIPEGFAHGFLTLQRDTDVHYTMNRAYQAGHAAGFRFDDPAVGIRWPELPKVIARADQEWPDIEHPF
ncbi:MAG: dTDP-4-dehydrorhamnose 3,5-epimerase family protein [Cohaesibacteraceae bacterium]